MLVVNTARVSAVISLSPVPAHSRSSVNVVVGQHKGQVLGWCLRWEEEGWEAEERLALAGCPRISEPELGHDGEIVCGHWRP